MKVIDLLNKIAKGEEVPKKIKYKNNIYTYEEFHIGYGENYFDAEWKKIKGYRRTENGIYFYLKAVTYGLNDEVEIIDQDYTEEKPITKEDIEALGYSCAEIKKSFETGWNKSLNNEPLEENNKTDIEKITLDDYIELTSENDLEYKMFEYIFNKNTNTFVNKINKLIDEVDKLKDDRK